MSTEKDEIIGKQKKDIDNLHGSLNENQRDISNLKEKVSKLESHKNELQNKWESAQKELKVVQVNLQTKVTLILCALFAKLLAKIALATI